MKHTIIATLIFAVLVFVVVAGIVFFIVGYMPYMVLTNIIGKQKKKPNYKWVFDLAKNQFKKNEVKN